MAGSRWLTGQESTWLLQKVYHVVHNGISGLCDWLVFQHSKC